MIWQPGEYVGEPGLRIDIVELGGLDQRVDGRSPAATFVGAGEGPVLAADGDGAQLAFGGIVGHAEPAVVEEAGEHLPALEAVVDRPGGLLGWVDFSVVKAGELAALIALELALMDRYGGRISKNKRSFASLLKYMGWQR